MGNLISRRTGASGSCRYCGASWRFEHIWYESTRVKGGRDYVFKYIVNGKEVGHLTKHYGPKGSAPPIPQVTGNVTFSGGYLKPKKGYGCLCKD